MGEGPRFPGVVPLENLVGTGIPVMVLLGAMLVGAVHRAPAGVVAVHLPVGPSELTEGLTVVMAPDGYVIALSEGSGLVSVPVPCRRHGCPSLHDWDLQGLQSSLEAIKAQVPEMQYVTFIPGASTPYEMVLESVFTARASRSGEPLFPLSVVSRPYDARASR